VRITIKALGQVAEVLGEREFELELKRGNAMSSVRDALCREHPELTPLWPSLAVAVNGEFIEAARSRAGMKSCSCPRSAAAKPVA